MKGFLQAAVIAASTTALSSLLAPEGKNRKWVKFLFSLAAFALLAASVAGFSFDSLREMPSLFPQQTADPGLSEDHMWRTMEKALATALAEKLGLPSSSVILALSEKRTPPLAEATLPHGSDTEAAADFLREQLGAGWEVTVHGR